VSERQRTLARPAEIKGVGLFFGQPVQLRCLPAPAGSGIVFVRTDLPGQPQIPAVIANVPPGPQRWTALRKGEAEVRMIEHLLSALFGLGIDNLVVETTAMEMPVGDGSAKTFTEPFLTAGVRDLDAPRRRGQLKRPVIVTESDIVLAAAPSTGGLSVTYILDYGQHFVRCQSLTLDVTRELFLDGIAGARTYVLRPEVDAFIKLGLGRGATPENTIVLEEDGRLSGSERFPDECVRHKILDMLGDLFLSGRFISARVIGYKSGHATNIRLAKAIAEACDADGQ
jgi:UDP-3-O-acyl N-acetylglucosamine deacetylase